MRRGVASLNVVSKGEDAMCPNGVWCEMLKGLPVFGASLIIGSIAAYIAYQQYRVSHGKFMLDLFEKRHTVYLHTADFLSRLMVSAEMDPRAVPIFRGETAAAAFLFKPEMAEFLKEVADKAALPRTQRDEVAAWAEQQIPTLADRFMPYMNLSAWH